MLVISRKGTGLELEVVIDEEETLSSESILRDEDEEGIPREERGKTRLAFVARTRQCMQETTLCSRMWSEFKLIRSCATYQARVQFPNTR